MLRVNSLNGLSVKHGKLYTYGYGLLYNWYAVDTGKLAPIGCHVPTDDEFKELEMFLGMSQAQADLTGWRGTDEGYKLKSRKDWWLSNGQGSNSSGFNGLSGGYRQYNNGSFGSLGNYGLWWSSSESSGDSAWGRRLYYNNDQVDRSNYNKAYGFSVRCILNTPSQWHKGMMVVDADGHKYPTVRIGNQVWLASNLKTTKYNDGTAIPNITDSTAWAALTTPAYCSYNNAAIQEYTETGY